MRRRRFLGLAATGMAGTAGMTATACGGSGSGEDGALRMVAAEYGRPGGGDSSQEYWDELTRAFTKKHPDITVEVSVHSWKDVDTKVAEMVREGRAPDIAQTGSYAQYAADGKLYDALELLPIPVQADFLPGLAEVGQVNRAQYGLPFVSSTRLLFYNRTLFVKAGLDPEAPPETWAGVEEAAEALKAVGVPYPYGLPLGPEEAPAEAMMWMLGGGGGYTDNVGNYTLDSGENIRTFGWLRDHLVGRRLTGTPPASTDRQEVFDAFARGRVGMLNGHPTLMRQAERAKVDYGTALLPGVNGVSGATMGVADWIMAFKQNGRREEAGTFLEFVFEEENHFRFASRYGLLPVTTSGAERMRGDDGSAKLWKFLEQLPGAAYYPVSKVSWGTVSKEIKDSMGKAVAKDASPMGILSAIQRKAQAAESAGAEG